MPGPTQLPISGLPNTTGSRATDIAPMTDTQDSTEAPTGTTKKYSNASIMTCFLKMMGYPTKYFVVAASTTNLNATYNNGTLGVGATLTNAGAQAAFILDGENGILNKRYEIKDQTNPAQNGIYDLTTVGTVSANWVLTRSVDFDQAADIAQNQLVVVQTGATNAEKIFKQTALGPFTMGTTAITFEQTQIVTNPSYPITIEDTAVGPKSGTKSTNTQLNILGNSVGTPVTGSFANIAISNDGNLNEAAFFGAYEFGGSGQAWLTIGTRNSGVDNLAIIINPDQSAAMNGSYYMQTLALSAIPFDAMQSGSSFSMFFNAPNLAQNTTIAIFDPGNVATLPLSLSNSGGLMAQTAPGLITPRTLTPGTGITISNGDGVAGNPIISSAPASLYGPTYISGFNLKWTSVTTMQLSAGTVQAISGDSAAISGAPINLDITTSGANGLDTGSVAGNKYYAVYAIWNSATPGTVAGMFSLAAPVPSVLPGGYNKYRRIGWASTTNVADIYIFSQVGAYNERKYFYHDVFNATKTAGGGQLLFQGQATTPDLVACFNLVPVGIKEIGVFVTLLSDIDNAAKFQIYNPDFSNANIIIPVFPIGINLTGYQLDIDLNSSGQFYYFFSGGAGHAAANVNLNWYNDYV